MFAHLKENMPLRPFVIEAASKQTANNSIEVKRSGSSFLWWMVGISFSVLVLTVLYLKRQWQRDEESEVLRIEEQETVKVEGVE